MTTIVSGTAAEVKGTVAFIELATSPGDWWKLSLKLRQRWWSETDFGRLPPSAELQQAVRDALSPPPAPVTAPEGAASNAEGGYVAAAARPPSTNSEVSS